MIRDKIKLLTNKKIIISISGMILIIFLTTGFVVCYQTHKQMNTVYNNIYIEDVNLSKLTKEELKYNLNEYFDNKLKNFNIEFYYNDIKENINSKDLGLYYDINKITEEIFNTGKTGNLFIDTINRLSINLKSKVFSFTPKIDESKIQQYIEHYVTLINKEKQEAIISFNGNSMSVKDAVIGYEVDIETFKSTILSILNSNNNIETNIKIDIPVNEVHPKVNTEIFKNMEILGSYSTSLASSPSGRTQNIRIFMQSLNNTVLLPGEQFSCDEKGGERTAKEGYTSAPGYSGNKVVQVLAGGICQGVTTLYNAVLYADLEIVERSPHSLLVTYAPIGRDATLAKNAVDFKFSNNQNNPIVIQTYVSNGQAIANIWGIKENTNKRIEIKVNQLGPKLSETYKNIYENDKLIKSQRISKDRYN